jgi:hypothetical protein
VATADAGSFEKSECFQNRGPPLLTRRRTVEAALARAETLSAFALEIVGLAEVGIL